MMVKVAPVCHGCVVYPMARGHETCTYDEHNISKNVYLISVNLSRSVDRKHLQGLESDFLSVPSFYISFYDYSKLTPGQ